MSIDAREHLFPPIDRVRSGDQSATEGGVLARRGHAAGYAAGLRAASAEIARQRTELEEHRRAVVAEERERSRVAVAALAAAAAQLATREVGVVADAQEVLAQATVELAEAVLASELSDGETSARTALTRALGHLGDAEPRRVRLHPADHAQLAAHGFDELDLRGVELVADPGLDRGDAVVDLYQGWLDARIGTALQRARAALTGEPR